jgi:rRNA processing protein Gar1
MSNDERTPLTAEELAREAVTALPDKEVISILDLAADIDLAIDGAAPIDLAIALNANVVAPIDAAVGANVLSDDSIAEALADQGVMVTQTVDADASANALQDSSIDQSDAAGDDVNDGAALAAQDVDDVAESGLVEPVDGSVVVDSTGAIIGVLDAATGNVLAPDGTIVGTLNAATGLVVDSAGNLVGTVTNLVDGATLLDSAGNILGTLDAVTGNVVNAAGNVVGVLNPLTGQVLDAAGNIVGTVADILDDVTDTLAGLDTGDLLKGDLLSVDVNVDLDADLAAPINGAVAANANVAAPIDAAVSANILSDGSQATAIAQQDAIITQTITGSADALSDQVSDIDQASIDSVDDDNASIDDAVSPADGAAPADDAALDDAAPDDAVTVP